MLVPLACWAGQVRWQEERHEACVAFLLHVFCCDSCQARNPPLASASLQAALPAEVFQGFVASLKPKQQQRLQEVLSA